MKHILLFGAGKSSTCLIDYLIENANIENWHITIADVSAAIIETKTNNANCTTAVAIDINDSTLRDELIGLADIVISLMPPALHFLIAQSCVVSSKNLLTASYVDDQIKKLEKEIEAKGLLFLCEMGLDPGIDHMSAMHIINSIKEKGGIITSFKSHCGGLVAPESDNNPWHYKISWNPRNVVTAGTSGAVYKVWDEIETVPYKEIFVDSSEIEVDSIGSLAWYPNRDSLGYIPIYKLEEAATFLRTTLRHPDFCRAWKIVIDLELTSDLDEALINDCSTYADWFNTKLYDLKKAKKGWEEFANEDIEEEYIGTITEMFEWLGFFSHNLLPQNKKCSSAILQDMLEKKLVLLPHEKDMVVMVHEIDYTLDNEEYTVVSSLLVKGENSLRTAMAKTVGLPLGIAAKLILSGTLRKTGLHIPIIKEIYEPVMEALQHHGISFTENVIKA